MFHFSLLRFCIVFSHRTVKTEDDTLESNTQEKSYSISGAADDEE